MTRRAAQTRSRLPGAVRADPLRSGSCSARAHRSPRSRASPTEQCRSVSHEAKLERFFTHPSPYETARDALDLLPVGAAKLFRTCHREVDDRSKENGALLRLDRPVACLRPPRLPTLHRSTLTAGPPRRGDPWSRMRIGSVCFLHRSGSEPSSRRPAAPERVGIRTHSHQAVRRGSAFHPTAAGGLRRLLARSASGLCAGCLVVEPRAGGCGPWRTLVRRDHTHPDESAPVPNLSVWPESSRRESGRSERPVEH